MILFSPLIINFYYPAMTSSSSSSSSSSRQQMREDPCQDYLYPYYIDPQPTTETLNSLIYVDYLPYFFLILKFFEFTVASINYKFT